MSCAKVILIIRSERSLFQRHLSELKGKVLISRKEVPYLFATMNYVLKSIAFVSLYRTSKYHRLLLTIVKATHRNFISNVKQ
ncbi:hypothetical protein [Clostridium sp. 1xD42-85]|uniref:hypothetical protein n=1 Tax=Clostridium sp. 1xD42-85 TaxID=2320084 RepID=UPI001A9B3D8A|nr:hypothetical protein [Clostridium sp. 1xD42-85]